MMNENGIDFWNRVKVLIKQSLTTQEGLAKSADLNFSNLKQQIFYNRLPDAAQATRIARALNTTVEFLVTGEETNPLAGKVTELENKLDMIRKIVDG